MLNEPAIDHLTELLGQEYEGSKFALCVVASKRARQLMDQVKNSNNESILNGLKPLSCAAFEIEDGKITAANN